MGELLLAHFNKLKSHTLYFPLIGKDGMVLITDTNDLKYFFNSENFFRGPIFHEILIDLSFF